MKININILTILFFFLSFGNTQTTIAQEEEDIFAYVSNKKGTRGTIFSDENDDKEKDYKYQVAKKVYDDLLDARGDHRVQAPEFVMNDGQRYVAWMNPKKVVIGLEELAYDICATFGKDSLSALAALLSHEVTHYYEKHNWKRHFSKKHVGLEISKELKGLNDHAKNETQADYLGGFLAFSAGYNTFGIMPALLENIYIEYGLPEELDGYPMLSDRTAMARQSMDNLQHLVHIFETGNFLVALEEYDDALVYYKYILKEYQSREIYNNVGITSALAALSLFDSDEIRFGYPFELDFDSRIKSVSRGGSTSDAQKELRESLLREAIDNFDQAFELDKNYATALLNTACAHALLNEPEDAEYFARKASGISKKLQQHKTLADANIISGIIAASQQDVKGANNYFDKAIALKSNLALQNKAILNGEKPALTNTARTGFSSAEEKIADISLDEFVDDLEVDTTLDIKSGHIICGIKTYDHSSILVNFVDDGYRYAMIHSTHPGYTGKTNKGIKIGSTEAEILEVYQQPDHRIGSSKGHLLIYNENKIIFTVNSNNIVERWSVFRLNKEE